jgi:hypothetical protein
MSDFEQRIQGKVGEMKNLQPTLAPLMVQLACNTLRESMQSCRQKPQDGGSQGSSSIVSPTQEFQSFLDGGLQMTGVNENFLRRLDSQYFMQALRDSGFDL